MSVSIDLITLFHRASVHQIPHWQTWIHIIVIYLTLKVEKTKRAGQTFPSLSCRLCLFYFFLTSCPLAFSFKIHLDAYFNLAPSVLKYRSWEKWFRNIHGATCVHRMRCAVPHQPAGTDLLFIFLSRSQCSQARRLLPFDTQNISSIWTGRLWSLTLNMRNVKNKHQRETAPAQFDHHLY